MIKNLRVFVEKDVPEIHLLNSVDFRPGEGTIEGEKVYMLEEREKKQSPVSPVQTASNNVRELAGAVESLRLASAPSQYNAQEAGIWSEGLNFAITKIIELLAK